MMKTVKRSFCIFLSILFLLTMLIPTAFAAESKGYTISNPYANVDFSTVKSYKAALHTHTNATDGDPTLKQSIERHVETGFDIVATTDHGTVNYTWETENANKLIHGALSLVGRSEGELEYLGKEGTFANGTSYKLTSENGDDYLVLNDGSKILRVPYGIEQNAISANAHVNSWFVDYHKDSITSYKDAISNVSRMGGICVINHPGEYSKARYEIHSSDAYNTDKLAYWYLVNKWASLLNEYDGCIGIDINSKGDDRTKYDRVLWDELLQRFSANGKNVFAICSSDAHQLDKINTGFIYALMPSLDSASLKSALKNGEFFGASHCIGNYEELVEIYNSLNEFYGESETCIAVKETVDKMATRIDDIETGKVDADSNIGITYKVLDDDGYFNGEAEPIITNIKVDDYTDTITISAENALIVRWISNGKLVTTTKGDESSFNLAEFSDKIGNYVRAEVFGEGGIVYTQAFILNAEQNANSSSVVDKGFFDFGILDCLVGIFENWGDILSRMIKNI